MSYHIKYDRPAVDYIIIIHNNEHNMCASSSQHPILTY